MQKIELFLTKFIHYKEKGTLTFILMNINFFTPTVSNFIKYKITYNKYSIQYYIKNCLLTPSYL